MDPGQVDRLAPPSATQLRHRGRSDRRKQNVALTSRPGALRRTTRLQILPLEIFPAASPYSHIQPPRCIGHTACARLARRRRRRFRTRRLPRPRQRADASLARPTLVRHATNFYALLLSITPSQRLLAAGGRSYRHGHPTPRSPEENSGGSVLGTAAYSDRNIDSIVRITLTCLTRCRPHLPTEVRGRIRT